MNPDFQQLAMEIAQREDPYGYLNDPYYPYRYELMMRINRLIEAAKMGYEVAQAQQQVVEHSQLALEQSRNEGYMLGLQASQQMALALKGQVDRQIQTAYNRGLQEGLAQANRSRPRNVSTPAAQVMPDPKAIMQAQRATLERALEQCHVIAESNPSMAAGAKAVARMIKKKCEPEAK